MQYNGFVTAVLDGRGTDELILDAADRLLARYGLRKMTMEDVAVEAGVSRRTVYGYFGSKQDLALASIDRVVRMAQERMAEEAGAPGTNAERLCRMLVARIEVRHEQVQDLSRSLDQMFEVIRPAYMQRRREWFEKEAEQLAQVIREGQTAGEFGAEDAVESASLLVRATNAYLPFSLSLEELGHAGEISRRLRRMAEILVSGLKDSAAAPRR